MAVHAQSPMKNGVVPDAQATAFFQQNKEGDNLWIASDGAISIPLHNGTVLWVMGDSHIGHYDKTTHTVPCLFQVRNCALVQQKGNWKEMKTLLGNRPGSKSFFKNKDSDSTWFWPGHGFEYKDTVYVYQSELRNTAAGGTFGFEATGRSYLAKLNPDTYKIIGYQLLPDFNKIDYPIGFIMDNNKEFVYAYGYSSDYIASNIHVARISLKDKNKWEFWNGTSWVTDPKEAAVIAQGASNGVSIQKYNGKYVMVSTEFSVGCDQGKRIFVATASAPTGPFTDRKAIYTIPDTLAGHYPFWYTPAIHPEYIKDGSILVTYCINGYENCIPACTNDRKNPDEYRPRGIRVPFEVLP